MFSDYLEGLIESIMILGIFYLCFVVFFNKEASFRQNRYFLLTGILFSFLLPFVEFTIPQNISIQRVIHLKTIDVLSPDNQLTDAFFSFSFTNVLCALYIFGVVFFFARFTLHLFKIFKLFRISKFQQSGTIKMLFTGKKHPAFSFLNLVFIDVDTEKSNDLEIIIKHELVHVVQKHSIDLLLFELLAIVQWFNPVVWFYRKSIKQNHEYLADHGVLSVGLPIERYQGILLQNYSSLTFGLANSFNHSLTFKRLIMMKKNSSNKKSSIIKLLAIIPVMLISVYFISCSEKDEVEKKELIQGEQKTEKAANTNEVVVVGDNGKTEIIEPVFKVVENMPQFPGGDDALRKFIATNVKYPHEARQKGIQGKVFVKFVISKSGKVIDPQIVRGVDPVLDGEAIRVVSVIPDWTPATQKGEKVNVEYTIPINFRLQ